jgi:hypothetical protein
MNAGVTAVADAAHAKTVTFIGFVTSSLQAGKASKIAPGEQIAPSRLQREQAMPSGTVRCHSARTFNAHSRDPKGEVGRLPFGPLLVPLAAFVDEGGTIQSATSLTACG